MHGLFLAKFNTTYETIISLIINFVYELKLVLSFCSMILSEILNHR